MAIKVCGNTVIPDQSGNANNNLALGANSGLGATTTGNNNNAIGNGAGQCNTSGAFNNFFGADAGRNNTTGGYNTFIGPGAGYDNTGSYNNVLGRYQMICMSGCSNHTFLGGGSSTSSGLTINPNNAIAFGGFSGTFNYGTAGQVLTSCGDSQAPVWAAASGGAVSVSGTDNIVSCISGYTGLSGSNNNVFGCLAGRYTSGNHGNFFGQCAGFYSTGGANNFFGRQAGAATTTGSYNNFFGYRAGISNTTGSQNNFFGKYAGAYNTTGTSNTFVGCYAGRCNTTGNCNTFIGLGAGYLRTGGNNNTMIGPNAGTTGSSSCVTVLGMYATFAEVNVGANFTGYTFLGGRVGEAGITLNNCNALAFCGGGCYGIFDYGTAGYVLTSCGDGAPPVWAAAGGGPFILYGSGMYGPTNIRSSLSCPGQLGGGNDNFFVGQNAGCANYGNRNNFIGKNAGQCNTTGSYNNFIGSSGGYCNTTGNYNNFFGLNAGYFNTTGSYNNFIGSNAGFDNTTGQRNNFFGRNAGYSNTTGSYNTFIGPGAGASNTGGCNNNFIGRYAGGCNIGGCNNNFFGADAGCAVTTGSNNLILGTYAGQSTLSDTIRLQAGCNSLQVSSAGCLTVNGSPVGGSSAFSVVTGFGGFPNIYSSVSGTNAGSYSSNNFFVGYCAGEYSFNGTDNTFIGQQAGGGGNYSGSSNNFFGAYSGYSNFSGSHNNFLGLWAGRNNSSGTNNNFFGCRSGRCNTSGSYNNFFGCNAGQGNTTGSHNVFMGQSAGRYNGTGCNNLAFGHNSGVSGFSPDGLFNLSGANNRIIMGNASHTCAQIQIGWTTVSDCRDKCIFGSVQHGRGFLQNLEPVEYAFKDRATGCITDIEGKRRYGFSAQNVLAAEGDNPVIVSTEDPEKLQLTSDYIIPVLVNAVNELSQELDALKARLAILESK
jgi:hypothetical protein